MEEALKDKNNQKINSILKSIPVLYDQTLDLFLVSLSGIKVDDILLIDTLPNEFSKIKYKLGASLTFHTIYNKGFTGIVDIKELHYNVEKTYKVDVKEKVDSYNEVYIYQTKTEDLKSFFVSEQHFMFGESPYIEIMFITKNNTSYKSFVDKYQLLTSLNHNLHRPELFKQKK